MGNNTRVIEQSIILLLGANERPVRSMLLLEKEVFLLTEAIPKFRKAIPFSAHYKGPYSQEVKELAIDPVYYKDAIDLNNGIRLTTKGKEAYKEIIEELKASPLYNSIITALKLIRTLYDKLSDNELLLLIYNSYPKYTKKSAISDEIYRDKEHLSQSLLKKRLITEERYAELSGQPNV